MNTHSKTPANSKQWLLVAEAACWLAVARLLLLFMPFGRIAKALGTFCAAELSQSASEADTPLQADTIPTRQATGVAQAVRRAAELLPFPVLCLPQALAASQMLTLRAIGNELHFGPCPLVTRTSSSPGSRFPSRPTLHAWLTAGPVEVTGFPAARLAVELGFFARGRRTL